MNADDVKRHARSLGFTLAGIAPIAPNPETTFFPTWLDRGFAGRRLSRLLSILAS